MQRLRQPLHRQASGEDREDSFAIEARSITRSFKQETVLHDVSLRVRKGEVHALLGPNGAGKTTLLRILSGSVEPKEGRVWIEGLPLSYPPSREQKALIGLVPSGERTFYMRLSGLENLVFFSRLHGMSRRDAVERARDRLRAVGLSDTGRKRVGIYSHGMQKRLSVARALLFDPAILLVDEATLGLDPQGARKVKDLVLKAASEGAAVLWTTQRIDEIRGLAEQVTVLHRGRVRFSGSLPALMARARSRAYMVQVENRISSDNTMKDAIQEALEGMGHATGNGQGDGHYRLLLKEGVILGDALANLSASGIGVLACREERSEIEDAFLTLTEGAT